MSAGSLRAFLQSWSDSRREGSPCPGNKMPFGAESLQGIGITASAEASAATFKRVFQMKLKQRRSRGTSVLTTSRQWAGAGMLIRLPAGSAGSSFPVTEL